MVVWDRAQAGEGCRLKETIKGTTKKKVFNNSTILSNSQSSSVY